MDIHVTVDPEQSTAHEFACVRLRAGEGEPSLLELDCSSLRTFGPVEGPRLEFLYFASVVYGIDKLVPRGLADDNWTRDLTVHLPVASPGQWTAVADDLTRCLNFLSGDRWDFHFSRRESTLFRPKKVTTRRTLIAPPKTSAVCLFSGGLDSLIGAIDWLESHASENLTLVGHHDPKVPGPSGDQDRLLEILRPAYPDRTRTLQTRIGMDPPGDEITLRSRSILFIALGVFAAASLGNLPLLIPENGTIALNVPLTPSRRGSCSTRTAHPYYLSTLQSALSGLGIPIRIENPLGRKTKGEAVSQCLNQDLIRRLAPVSASCAKRGHTFTWVNKSALNCGRCMPCIYRRAALHAIGLDTEVYGADVCTGEVDLDDTELDAPNDFRACVSFLRQALPEEQMASLLMASGRLPLGDLPAYASVVVRAMDEIRQLLRDKATNDIKRRAGIR